MIRRPYRTYSRANISFAPLAGVPELSPEVAQYVQDVPQQLYKSPGLLSRLFSPRRAAEIDAINTQWISKVIGDELELAKLPKRLEITEETQLKYLPERQRILTEADIEKQKRLQELTSRSEEERLDRITQKISDSLGVDLPTAKKLAILSGLSGLQQGIGPEARQFSQSLTGVQLGQDSGYLSTLSGAERKRAEQELKSREAEIELIPYKEAATKAQLEEDKLNSLLRSSPDYQNFLKERELARMREQKLQAELGSMFYQIPTGTIAARENLFNNAGVLTIPGYNIINNTPSSSFQSALSSVLSGSPLSQAPRAIKFPPMSSFQANQQPTNQIPSLIRVDDLDEKTKEAIKMLKLLK